jgi:amidase
MNGSFDELSQLDLIDQAALVRRGAVTPLELVDAAVARIESVNPLLNAVVTPLFDQARAVAVSPDLPHGPLRGVPFLVKDLGAAMAGVPETEGSRALREFLPKADSPLVARYRAAGLLIVGRTNTPEFGNHATSEPELHGATRNPWDLSRTAGGSSGGSGAAVASLMVAAAHGGDGAGSIRIPASCCGLFGLKPSRGRISRAPAGEQIGGLSTRHAITRTVRDSAVLLDLEAGRVPGDPYSAEPPVRPFLEEIGREPGRLRIGWSVQHPLDEEVDPDCIEAVRVTAALLESLGHDVEEAAPTFDPEVLIGPLVTVWAAGNLVYSSHCEDVLGRPLRDDELELTTREFVEYGRTLTAIDLIQAVDALGVATRSTASYFETYDAWLTPTLARVPELLGVLNQSQGGAIEFWKFDCTFNPWNPLANITGNPAMSVPLYWTPGGLPVGSLFTGRYGDEASLFRLASQLEGERPWANRIPPVHA